LLSFSPDFSYCLLPCSQQRANSPYSPPIPFHYTHFNIIFSSTPRTSQCSLSHRIFPAVYYRVHNSAPTVLTLRQFHFLIPILILSFHLHLELPSALFLTGFSLSHTNSHWRSLPPAFRPPHSLFLKGTDHEDPHDGSSPKLLSLSPSFIQLSSSEFPFRKSTLYSVPSLKVKEPV